MSHPTIVDNSIKEIKPLDIIFEYLQKPFPNSKHHSPNPHGEKKDMH